MNTRPTVSSSQAGRSSCVGATCGRFFGATGAGGAVSAERFGTSFATGLGFATDDDGGGVVDVDAAGDGVADWSFARRFKRIYVHTGQRPYKCSRRGTRTLSASSCGFVMADGGRGRCAEGSRTLRWDVSSSAQDAYAEWRLAAGRPAFSATANVRHPAASASTPVFTVAAANMLSFSRVLTTARLFSTSAVAEAGYKLKSHSGAKKRWRSIASGIFKRVCSVSRNRGCACSYIGLFSLRFRGMLGTSI